MILYTFLMVGGVPVTFHAFRNFFSTFPCFRKKNVSRSMRAYRTQMWHGRPGLPIRAVSIWQRSLYTSYRKDDSAGTLGDSCTTSTLFVPSQRMPSHIDFCHLPLACDDSTVVPETHCQSTSMPANARLLTLHILGLDDPDLQSFSVHSIPQVINLSSTHGFTVQT